MAANLVFGSARHAGGPAHLVFGATDAPPAPDPVSVVGAVSFAGMAATGLVQYDNRNPRRTTTGAALPHQVAGRLLTEPKSTWGNTQRELGGAASAWQVARAAAGAGMLGWASAGRAAARTAAPWQLGAHMQAQAAMSHEAAARIGSSAASAWQVAQLGRSMQAALVHQVALTLLAAANTTWASAERLQALAAALAGVASPRAAQLLAPWQVARAVPPGREVWPPVNPNQFTPRVPSTHLLFACPPWVGGGVHLVFGRVCAGLPAAGIAIPVRSTYMAQNNVTLLRLPAGDAFEASRFTLQLDADSFTFGWSASLHASALPQLTRSAPGERVEVQCAVNGVLLRLVIEQIGHDRSFPEHRIQVRGRGRSAELADVDLSFSNPAARTAQQLMADVLTVNNASLDWTLDWQITDWLIPANTWAFRGSYIGALQDIASAAGAYLQPHRTEKVIRVLPRYPHAPWDWATLLVPDVELPVEATSVEGIEEVIRPNYNRVFVGGVVAPGYFGPVTRAGTAGDQVASPIVHPLITAPEAHIQRGRAELSNTGVQEHLSLRTMVLPEAGIILPGAAVRYVAEDGPRLGLVRGTNVSMDRWPALHQTLEIETHVQ